jgi:hypothetical protein
MKLTQDRPDQKERKKNTDKNNRENSIRLQVGRNRKDLLIITPTMEAPTKDSKPNTR